MFDDTSPPKAMNVRDAHALYKSLSFQSDEPIGWIGYGQFLEYSGAWLERDFPGCCAGGGIV